VSITEADAIAVAAITHTGTLALNAGTNDITQSGVINVGTGATSLTGGAITLNSANVLGAVTVAAGTGNVSITEADAIAVAAITHTGTLALNAGTNAISQTGPIEIGSGALTLTGGTITLTDDNNTMGALTFNSAGAVNIKEDSNMLVAGINTAGTLLLQTPANMDSVSGTAITVTGTTVSLLAGGTIGGLEAGDVAKTTLAGQGYNAFGTITANSSNIVVQAGGVTDGVSVDIVGTSINSLLTLTPPNVPSGAVLLNGLSVTAPPFIKGLSPMAGSAAVVAAQSTTLTGNGGIVSAPLQSMADVFIATEFPTESVRAQMTAGVGVVGLLSPLVTLQGIGVNVSAELASSFQRQQDKAKK